MKSLNEEVNLLNFKGMGLICSHFIYVIITSVIIGLGIGYLLIMIVV